MALGGDGHRVSSWGAEWGELRSRASWGEPAQPGTPPQVVQGTCEEGASGTARCTRATSEETVETVHRESSGERARRGWGEAYWKYVSHVPEDVSRQSAAVDRFPGLADLEDFAGLIHLLEELARDDGLVVVRVDPVLALVIAGVEQVLENGLDGVGLPATAALGR